MTNSSLLYVKVSSFTSSLMLRTSVGYTFPEFLTRPHTKSQDIPSVLGSYHGLSKHL